MENIIGKKFNSLVALKRIGKGGLYLFKCDCGKEKEIVARYVVRNIVKSCGCMNHIYGQETKYKNGFKTKIVKCSHGYLKVWDRKENKYIYLHRKVMNDKLFKTTNKHIHHIDGNKENNHINNLVVLEPKTHFRLERGWKLIDNKWFKICKSCDRLLEVNKENFYFRKSGRVGKVINPCIKCVKKNWLSSLRQPMGK